MSLNFDFTNIKGKPHIFYTNKEDEENGRGWYLPMTDALIWLHMTLDMMGITKENVDEWWFRLCVYRKITGNYFLHHDELDDDCVGVSPWEITKQDIIKHIGMTTNVSQKTRKQFMDKQIRIITKECERTASRYNYPQPIFNDEEKKKFDKMRRRFIKKWKEAKVEGSDELLLKTFSELLFGVSNKKLHLPSVNL